MTVRIKSAKPSLAGRIRRPKMSGGNAAFGGGGGVHAFRDPTTMVAPDQAFSAAMAKPAGGGAAIQAAPGGAPSGPMSLPMPQG